MKVLVAVKRVIDPYVKIRVKESGIETQNVKMAMNPFDEIAVEEALRLKEAGIATDIVAISIGNDGCQDTLRHALALGVDRAILIKTELKHCSLHIAKILAKMAIQENIVLALLGKQSIDGDNNQTPQMLAALLSWPQATYASHIALIGDKVTVQREVDGGIETLELNLPAVISTDLRLNEPRYTTLPNIMRAKQKTLITIELASLKLDLQEHLQIIKVMSPKNRTNSVQLQSTDELSEKIYPFVSGG